MSAEVDWRSALFKWCSIQDDPPNNPAAPRSEPSLDATQQEINSFAGGGPMDVQEMAEMISSIVRDETRGFLSPASISQPASAPGPTPMRAEASLDISPPDAVLAKLGPPSPQVILPPPPVYEDLFPALSGSSTTSQQPRQQVQVVKKAKKRIRSTLVVAPGAAGASAGRSIGNIARISSRAEEPAVVVPAVTVGASAGRSIGNIARISSGAEEPAAVAPAVTIGFGHDRHLRHQETTPSEQQQQQQQVMPQTPPRRPETIAAAAAAANASAFDVPETLAPLALLKTRSASGSAASFAAAAPPKPPLRVAVGSSSPSSPRLASGAAATLDAATTKALDALDVPGPGSAHLAPLRCLAKLFGRLVSERLTTARTDEVLFLFQLLRFAHGGSNGGVPLPPSPVVTRSSFATTSNEGAAAAAAAAAAADPAVATLFADKKAEEEPPPPLAPPNDHGNSQQFFTCAVDCGVFASAALSACFPLLRHLGPTVLRFLLDDPLLRRVEPEFAAAVKFAVETHRRLLPPTMSLLRVGGRGLAGGGLMGGGGGFVNAPSFANNSDLSLPFREETDSRHHFRTLEQSRVYSNREQSRDAFLRLLRLHQTVKRKLDDKRLAKLRSEFPSQVAGLLGGLLPGNAEWFASLLVDHLAQSALDNETDVDVLRHKVLANADPQKLQQLHRRLSSKPGQQQQQQQQQLQQQAFYQKAGDLGGSAGAAAQGNASMNARGGKGVGKGGGHQKQHPQYSSAHRPHHTGGGGGGGACGNSRSSSGSSSSSSLAASSSASSSASSPAAVLKALQTSTGLGDPSDLFATPSESFFFEFLEVANSGWLARLVEALLVARIADATERWFALSTAAAPPPSVSSALLASTPPTTPPKKKPPLSSSLSSPPSSPSKAPASPMSPPQKAKPPASMQGLPIGRAATSSNAGAAAAAAAAAVGGRGGESFEGQTSASPPSPLPPPSPLSNSEGLQHPLDGEESVDELVKLRLLARFLGYLSFRSHWSLSLTAHSSSLQASLSGAPPSVAFAAALRDATAFCEHTSSPPALKVQSFLDRAVQQGCLALVVPWVAEFLKMLKWDLVLRKTAYFERALGSLRAVHFALDPSSKGFNANYACVAFELEALFRDLDRMAPLPPPATLPRKLSRALSASTLSSAAGSSFLASAATSTSSSLYSLLSPPPSPSLPSSSASSSSSLLARRPFSVDANSLIGHRCLSRHLCGGVEHLVAGLVSTKRAPSSFGHPGGGGGGSGGGLAGGSSPANALGGCGNSYMKKVRPHVVTPKNASSSSSSLATAMPHPTPDSISAQEAPAQRTVPFVNAEGTLLDAGVVLRKVPSVAALSASPALVPLPTTSSLPPPPPSPSSSSSSSLSSADTVAANAAEATAHFQRRLRSTFFRRYPSLQRVADLVLDQVVRNCVDLALAACKQQLAPLLHTASLSDGHGGGGGGQENAQEEGGEGGGGGGGGRGGVSGISESSAIVKKARAIADGVAKAHFPAAIEQAMTALAPPTLPKEVAKTALKLAVSHALTVGRDAVVDATANKVLLQAPRWKKEAPPVLPPQPPQQQACQRDGGAAAAAAAAATAVTGRAETVPLQPPQDTPRGGGATSVAEESEDALEALLCVCKTDGAFGRRCETDPDYFGSSIAVVASALSGCVEVVTTEKGAPPSPSLCLLRVSSLTALLGLLPPLWLCVRSFEARLQREGAATAKRENAFCPLLHKQVFAGGVLDKEVTVSFFLRLVDTGLTSLAALEQGLVDAVAVLAGTSTEEQGSADTGSHERVRCVASHLVNVVKARFPGGGEGKAPLHCQRLQAALAV